MPLDDELVQAGETLDRLSRAHAPRRAHPAPRPPMRWALVAAAAVVVVAVVGVAVLAARDTKRTAPISVPDSVPDTGSGSTIASDTVPTTAAVPSAAYWCLADTAPVTALGATFEIRRAPSCSASSTVFVSGSSASDAACAGPGVAELSNGQRMKFVPSAGAFDVDGAWEAVAEGSTVPAIEIEYQSFFEVQRALRLPPGTEGDLAFTFEITCGAVTDEVTLPFSLRRADPAGIEVVKEFTDVEYYGACGNETALVEGLTWYPLKPQQLELLDASLYPAEVVAATQLAFDLRPRVMPPGPGDDIGTVLVYDDGIARFESESGRVIWLTDQEQTYNWVC